MTETWRRRGDRGPKSLIFKRRHRKAEVRRHPILRMGVGLLPAAGRAQISIVSDQTERDVEGRAICKTKEKPPGAAASQGFRFRVIC